MSFDSGHSMTKHFIGKFLTLITRDKGDGIPYEFVIIRDGVCVVILTGEGKFRLLLEKKHWQETAKLQLVAGYIDKNETPEDCARRELREEAGLEADEMSLYLTSTPENGSIIHAQYFFTARGLSTISGGATPEVGEDIRGTQDFSPEEVLKMALRGDFGTTETAYVLTRLATKLLKN